MRARVLLAAACATLLALTGCSAATHSDNAYGPLTLWTDSIRLDAMKQLAADFEKQDHIKINVVVRKGDAVTDDFVQQVPSGKGPDLIVTAHDGLGKLVQNGVVNPVDIPTERFRKEAIKAVTYDGKIYGVPYATENLGLVRNDDLTKAEPKTFTEMIDAGRQSGAEYPFVIDQDPELGDPYHMYPFQTSFGAPVFKSDKFGYTTDLGMAGKEGKNFANWLAQQGKNGSIDAHITGDKSKQLFMDGKVAFQITGPWNTSAYEEAGRHISVLPIPSAGGKKASPFLGVQVFFASNKTSNPVLVRKFFDYVASERGQKLLFKLDPRVPAQTKISASMKDPVLRGFLTAGEGASPMPALPQMGSVWKFWGGTELNILTGKQDPTKGWDRMNANIVNEIGAK